MKIISARNQSFNRNAGDDVEYVFSSNFCALVTVIGQKSDAYGAYLVQGYGAGTARIHVATLLQGSSTSYTISESEPAIRVINNAVNTIHTIMMIYGNLVTVR